MVLSSVFSWSETQESIDKDMLYDYARASYGTSSRLCKKKCSQTDDKAMDIKGWLKLLHTIDNTIYQSVKKIH